MRSAGVLLSLCFLAPGVARAAPPADVPERPKSLELSHTSTAWLIGELGFTAAALTVAVAASRQSPDACRWCRSNGFDEGARSALVAARPRVAGMVSDLGVAGVLPALSLAALVAPAYAAGERRHALQNVVIVGTATGLSLAVATSLKAAFARERPSEHHGVRARSPAREHPGERYLSFYSSHTAAAFAVASSVTTVSYLRGYEGAPFVAVAGGVFGAGIGLLRIAADMHWASDVLTGAGVGTLVGAAVPLLLHRRQAPSFALTPSLGRRSAGLVAFGSF